MSEAATTCTPTWTAGVATQPQPTQPQQPQSAADAVRSRGESDVVQSVRNAAKLGASLIATWAVALGVRLYLPRHLGPAMFGAFQFADAFSVTLLVVTNLGLETYIRTEVSKRHAHASEFFGGAFVLRLALSAVLVLGGVAALAAAGKPSLVQQLVFVLAVAQVVTIANGTYAAILHSVGHVNGLSVLNVVSKLVWGLGIAAGLALGGGVLSVAVALLGSEVLKAAGLAVLSRRHLGLRYDVRVRETTTVVVASLPFLIASLSQTVLSRIDMTFLSFMVGDVEAGWYGAAANLAGMAMLLSPLIWWVLLPLTSRAGERSDEELTTLLRRAMELVLAAAIPVTLFLALGADVIIETLFGSAFAPAATSLRMLAPMFVLTYANMVSCSVLIRDGRGWVVTRTLLLGLVVSPLLNWLLIPRFSEAFGPGGAGIGAATSLVITEALITGIVTYLVGSQVFDRRSYRMMGKTLVVCAAVAALHVALAPIGALRLIADGLVYVAAVVAWKAVDIRSIVEFIRRALARRSRGTTGAV